MLALPHLATRLFGTPLLIHQPKLDTILAVLSTRLGLPELAASAAPPTSHEPAPGSAQVAVIPILGTLVRRTVGLEALSGLTSYTSIAQQLDAALTDDAVQAILLDIDSPGGESAGVFDLADRIRSASYLKPVWAVANDMAFSAAYAIGSAATRLFVPRTGGVGSIGVIAMHVDQSGKDAQDGVRYTTVFAGDRKNDLNPHEPLSSEAHDLLKSEVDRVYGLFVQTVAQHRGLPVEAVRATQAGLFFGQDAVQAGLADAVGTFDDALQALHQTLAPPDIGPSISSASSPTSPLMDEHPSLTLADAIHIAQSCTLAGRSELIAGFLESGTSPGAVRSQLLAAIAAASPEVTSRLQPQASTSSEANPLIDAVKHIAAQAALFKKDI